MEWKIEEIELVFLGLGTPTIVGVDLQVSLTDGSSIECVLPLFTHAETKEEVKRLVAEHIDPYDIREYVLSSIETMVKFKSAVNEGSKNNVESYLRFTEGIIYNIGQGGEGQNE